MPVLLKIEFVATPPRTPRTDGRSRPPPPQGEAPPPSTAPAPPRAPPPPAAAGGRPGPVSATLPAPRRAAPSLTELAAIRHPAVLPQLQLRHFPRLANDGAEGGGVRGQRSCRDRARKGCRATGGCRAPAPRGGADGDSPRPGAGPEGRGGQAARSPPARSRRVPVGTGRPAGLRVACAVRPAARLGGASAFRTARSRGAGAPQASGCCYRGKKAFLLRLILVVICVSPADSGAGSERQREGDRGFALLLIQRCRRGFLRDAPALLKAAFPQHSALTFSAPTRVLGPGRRRCGSPHL